MKQFLLSAIAALAGITATAQTTFKQAPFTYKVVAPGKVEVSAVDSKSEQGLTILSYDVPSTVQNGNDTYTVTSIGEEAFKWKSSVKTVTLPETVDTLHADAFNSCGLTAITLPKNLRCIGDYAFSSAKFTAIDIPESVDSIGKGAFFSCQSLESVNLPKNLKKLGTSVFYNCGITSIVLPESLTEIPYSTFQSCKKLASVTIQSPIKTVGKMAFLKCAALKSISLPSSVDSIGYEAFCNTGLETFTLPKGVRAIDEEFIANAPITTFAIEEGNEHFALYDGAIYSKDKRILYAAPVKGITSFTVQDGCLGIYGGAFSQCEATEIKLPESVIALDSFAFCEAKVAKINLPKGIKLIGEQCFAGTDLTEVTIPESSTIIYEAAFALCKSLKKVTLPATVTDIAIRAFLQCSALESITCLGATAPKLEDAYEQYEEQFYGVPSTCQLIVPQGATQSYKDAGWNSWFTITEAQPTELGVVKTTPADGYHADMTASPYFNMSFDIEFDDDFTVVKKNPDAKLREGNKDTGSVIEPDDVWVASRNKVNHLNLWGADWDGYTCYFRLKSNTDYYLTIPAGIVKGKTSGLANGEIVISFTTSKSTGIDNAEASETNVKVTGVYDMSGRKIDNAPIKGIVIKKLSNGKSVKVLNK